MSICIDKISQQTSTSVSLISGMDTRALLVQSATRYPLLSLKNSHLALGLWLVPSTTMKTMDAPMRKKAETTTTIRIRFKIWFLETYVIVLTIDRRWTHRMTIRKPILKTSILWQIGITCIVHIMSLASNQITIINNIVLGDS